MKFIVLVLCFLYFCTTQAQEINKTYTITLKDGSIITGKILDMNTSFWTIETETIGVIQMPFGKIASFKSSNNKETFIIEVQTKTDSINPVPERYLFMPSAYTLKKRTGLYNNSWIFFNGFDYGITDHWSIGTNSLFIYIPLVVSLHTKYSFDIAPKIKTAFQFDYFVTTFTEGGFVAFALQGMTTFGTEKKNLTLQISKFFSWNLQEIQGVLIGLHHISTLGKQTYFITQNQLWVLDNNDRVLIPSVGLRLTKKKSVFDISWMGIHPLYSQSTRSIFFIPYIGYQLALGKRK